jgi:ppGpp synthetase/RelA/SpoT-type nucleotidyltranferase
MNIIETKIEEFKTWYEKQYNHHEESVSFFCNLILPLPHVESVTGRIKSYEECVSKFKRKYLPNVNIEEEKFQISSHITDLIGIRAICFYPEEVRSIRRSLKKYFREIEITDKSRLLEKTDDKFGYKSLHLQLVLKKGLKGLKGIEEYGKFKNLKIELQVRTLIQDAWSSLDHKIKYKKSIPQNLKRRINRLSALFEIADDEFMSIQKEISQEESKVSKRLKKGSKIEKSKTLDVFRFLFIALKYFPDYNFIEYKVDGFVQELLLQKPIFTEGELNEALQSNLAFVDAIEVNIKQRLNPYTKIRYCLYKKDSETFKTILSLHQREVFHKKYNTP